MTDRVDQLADATTQARQLLSEVHAAIKDLKTAHRQIHECIEKGVYKLVEDTTRKALEQQIDLLTRATKAEMARSTAKVMREFNRLSDLCLGLDQPETPETRSLEELIRSARAAGAVHRDTGR